MTKDGMTSGTPAWDRLQGLFRQALERKGAGRKAFIDEVRANDASVAAQLERLLAGHEHGSDGGDEAPPRAASLTGRAIAGYRILDLLGEGGMGAVYRAEQKQPQREVAFKVIHAGVTGPAGLRRFEHEAEILGRLQHPGIGQVYDAGTFNAGYGAQPYFAMELVRGTALAEYADAHSLSLHERLALIAEIADAVQHAHQRGVIHRDLKPANILVDQEGAPRVLDFGVARVTDADLRNTMLQTGVGQLVGTIPYMSPEQATGDPAALDTRSDVYALGVLTFELLANRLPHDVRAKTVPEAVRAIREDEPPSLSSIDRACRGDVETIVRKALEKDPERRYQTAAALASDIRRCLNDEPITARPPSGVEQLRRFARRHKPLAGGLAAGLSLLVVGIVLTSIATFRAMSAEANERTHADTVETVVEFLAGMLAGADPAADPGHAVTVREVLDDAAERAGPDFADRPVVLARIRTVIGEAYHGLGRYADAVVQIEEAHGLAVAHIGTDERETIEIARKLGVALDSAGRTDDARAVFAPLVEQAPRVLGEDDELTLTVLGRAAANRYYSSPAEAADLWRRLLPLQQRALGTGHVETITTSQNLAVALTELRELEEAETLCRAALADYRAMVGHDHPDTITILGNLAWILLVAKKPADAEPVAREAIALGERVMGPDHPDTAFLRMHLARSLGEQARIDDAEAIYLTVAGSLEARLGPDHRESIAPVRQHARLLRDVGRNAEAAPLYADVLERQRRAFGDDHLNTLQTMNEAASNFLDLADLDAAGALSAEMIEHMEASGLDSHHVAVFRQTRGICLMELGRYEEAEAQALQAHTQYADLFGADDEKTRKMAATLVKLYEAWARPDDAAGWRARAGG